MKIKYLIFLTVYLSLCQSIFGQVQSLQISATIQDHIFLSEAEESGIKKINVWETEIYQKNKRRTDSIKRKAYTIAFEWDKRQANIIFNGSGNLYFSNEPTENSEFYFLKYLSEAKVQSNSSGIIRWNDNNKITFVKVFSDTNYSQLQSETNYFYAGEKLIGFTKKSAHSGNYSQYQLDYLTPNIILSKSKLNTIESEWKSISEDSKIIMDEWSLDYNGNLLQHIEFQNGELSRKTSLEYIDNQMKSLTEFIYHPRTNKPILYNSITCSEFDSLSVRTSIKYPFLTLVLKRKVYLEYDIPIVQVNTMVNGTIVKSESSWGKKITGWEFVNGNATSGEEFELVGHMSKRVSKSEKRTYENGRIKTVFSWVSIHGSKFKFEYEYIEN